MNCTFVPRFKNRTLDSQNKRTWKGANYFQIDLVRWSKISPKLYIPFYFQLYIKIVIMLQPELFLFQIIKDEILHKYHFISITPHWSSATVFYLVILFLLFGFLFAFNVAKRTIFKSFKRCHITLYPFSGSRCLF